MSYIAALDASEDDSDFRLLGEVLVRFGESGARRLFYLALPPAAIAPTIERLSRTGFAGPGFAAGDCGWARVIVEKPFGRDLESARALNVQVASAVDEADLFRIDHFLGKEAVQNLFAFRFANGIFEPVWNRNFIDHVQITAAETLGMEGRGSYYETAGALRDMVQSHLLQLLALVAIEPPAAWTPDDVRDEKAQVLRAIRQIREEDVPNVAVRGQYGAGEVDGASVAAYRDEANVAADSTVETYAALELYVDNWRWAGVPFYLRSGKRLSSRVTEIVVKFKPAPHSIFRDAEGRGALRSNTLRVRVGPREGLYLEVDGKQPGQGMRLRPVELDYSELDSTGTPSAYEYLLLDAMRGRSTLFARADEVEHSWRAVQPVLDRWAGEEPERFPNYDAGTSGPPEAEELLARSGRAWHRLT
jgi:glucose-6-phosphate 1-dehydrogenase